MKKTHAILSDIKFIKRNIASCRNEQNIEICFNLIENLQKKYKDFNEIPVFIKELQTFLTDKIKHLPDIQQKP